MAIKHLECYNDGVVVELHTDALDDYQQSAYLPDVVERLTGNIEVMVGNDAKITQTSNVYGRDTNGRPQFAASPLMAYFSEGSTAYGVPDFYGCATCCKRPSTTTLTSPAAVHKHQPCCQR